LEAARITHALLQAKGAHDRVRGIVIGAGPSKAQSGGQQDQQDGEDFGFHGAIECSKTNATAQRYERD
jgi:hypothetical protein